MASFHAILVFVCCLNHSAVHALLRSSAGFGVLSRKVEQVDTIIEDVSKSARTIAELQPSLGDAAQRTELTVELLNGLGNQLFQVATLLSTALDHSPRFSVVLPNIDHVRGNRSTYWHSVLRKLQPLLGNHSMYNVPANDTALRLVDTCAVEQVPKFDALDKNCSRATVFEPSWDSSLGSRQLHSCGVVTLRGYFQNLHFFEKHLPLMRQIFWNDDIGEEARQRLTAIIKGHGGPVVSVHYRLKDYEPNGWVLSRDYYDEALSQVQKSMGNDTLCLVFSDDPERAWQRSASLDTCAHRVLVPKNESDVISLYMMSLTNASVLADSTFSYFAALLGREKSLVIAPRMAGPKVGCWSYLQEGPANGATWQIVDADVLSSSQLLVDEVMSISDF